MTLVIKNNTTTDVHIQDLGAESTALLDAAGSQVSTIHEHSLGLAKPIEVRRNSDVSVDLLFSKYQSSAVAVRLRGVVLPIPSEAW